MENMDEKKKDIFKKKKTFIIIFICFIMLGVVIGGYYYWQGKTYFTTDNAKVTTELRKVMPLSNGRLIKLNVSEGSIVKENDVIGRLQNGSYLRSPINGEVVECNVVLNQMVSPTVTAAVIADTSNIYIASNIEETDISKIKEGQEVIVKLDAYPGKSFKGHVKQIDKVTQSALSGNVTSFSTSGTYTKVTQLIPVKIVIDDNVDLGRLIGTNCTIKVRTR